MAGDPLILTAAFDAVSARLFQDLRDRHFPARLNIVPAHLTLFHHLPGTERDAILESLQAEATAALPFTTGALRFLGRGVAVEILCPPLAALRAGLAARWSASLTAQDRQGFRPHVTVQNKVPPAEARATMERLADSGSGLAGTITGLDLWWYRGGPGERAGAVQSIVVGGG